MTYGPEELALRRRLLGDLAKLYQVTPAIEALPTRTIEALLQEARMRAR